MKRNPFSMRLIPAVAAGLLAFSSQSQAQMPITNVINTFDAAPGSGNEIGMEWGPGTWAWDGVNGNPPGAAHYTASWDPTSDTPLVGFACEIGGNPWYTPNPINFSTYTNLEFDLKWDNSSEITIDQFNDVSTWPYSLTNSRSGGQSVFQSWATGGGTNLAAGGSTVGVEVTLCGGPAGQMAPTLAFITFPAAASNGWVHINIPINQAQSDIDGVSGIVFHKWTANTWTLQTNVTASFWIDNVMVTGTAVPPPPPTVHSPEKAVQGFNVFASTAGNSYYDRQEAMTVISNDMSWIGVATPANPVTYSFSIADFPTDPATYGAEAYLFLSPYPGYNPSAPDWNNTNCTIAFVQMDTNGAMLHFQYKADEAGQNQMYGGASGYTNAPGSWDGVTAGYLESGNLGSVTNPTAIGTWTIKFTSDTNVTLIAPGGNTSSFTIPAYNVAKLGPTGNGYNGLNLFLGFQANNAASLNKAVVYSSFAVTGVPSAFSENFMTESTLNTNIWLTSMSGGPAGVRVVPSDAAYWLSWTLPDAGFSSQVAGSLTNSVWTTPAGPLIGMVNQKAQLLSTSDLPAGSSAFFRLIKRTYTQLQVLWPGETNAPDTASGVIGTPTPVNASDVVNVTINAVDSTYHIVNVSGGNLSGTLGGTAGGFWNGDVAFTAGTATGQVAFTGSGTATLTVTDTVNTNIPPATSSSLTVN